MYMIRLYIRYKKIACINFIIILVIIIYSKCMHKINCPSSSRDDNFCFNTTDLLSERSGCSNSLSTDRRRNSLNEVASYSGVGGIPHTRARTCACTPARPRQPSRAGHAQWITRDTKNNNNYYSKFIQSL